MSNEPTQDITVKLTETLLDIAEEPNKWDSRIGHILRDAVAEQRKPLPEEPIEWNVGDWFKWEEGTSHSATIQICDMSEGMLSLIWRNSIGECIAGVAADHDVANAVPCDPPEWAVLSPARAPVTDAEALRDVVMPLME